jgi:hypothetical protein
MSKKSKEKKKPAMPRYTWNVTGLQREDPVEIEITPVTDGKGEFPSFKAAMNELLGSIDDQIAHLKYWRRSLKKSRAKDFPPAGPK